MDVHAKGQRVVVTAGGAGIGRAIAEAFSDNGARVHVCDIDPARLSDLAARRPEIGTSACDVALVEHVDAFMDEALARLGGIDVLVNNAGISGPTAAVEDVAPRDWDRTIAVCLNAMFYCIRRAVPEMKRQRSGCIINISSTSGKLAFPLRSPYATAKLAVNGLTHTLAAELGPHNIRVNSILPGWVEGERAQRVMREKSKALGISTAEFEARALQFIAMRTRVDAQEIADMAVYLASRQGRHISGQWIAVDGNIELER